MGLHSLIKQSLHLTLLIFCVFFPACICCTAKIEVAPAYIHIDVIEGRKTVKELDMGGIRADVCWVSTNGWLIKPSGIYGKEKGGELSTGNIAFGRSIPLNKKWILSPSIGISYTQMKTSIHIDLGEIGKKKYKERFDGYCTYGSLELIYNIAKNVRVCASAQYGWSRSKTIIKGLFTSKSDAEGPSYAAQIEYDINKNWSVNLGGAYNESFSEEKNGIRGRGIKLGIARWF